MARVCLRSVGCIFFLIFPTTKKEKEEGKEAEGEERREKQGITTLGNEQCSSGVVSDSTCKKGVSSPGAAFTVD